MRTRPVVLSAVAAALLVAGCSTGAGEPEPSPRSAAGSVSAASGAAGADMGDDLRLERLCERFVGFADASDSIQQAADEAIRAGEDPAVHFADLSHLAAVTFAEPPQQLRDPVATVREFIDLHLPALIVHDVAVATGAEVLELDLDSEVVLAFQDATVQIDDACQPWLSGER